MVLQWITQLPTDGYLVAPHKQKVSVRQHVKPHWPVLTNSLTTASQCLRQHQREEELKVHLLLSSQMKTVSLWLKSFLISLFVHDTDMIIPDGIRECDVWLC